MEIGIVGKGLKGNSKVPLNPVGRHTKRNGNSARDMKARARQKVGVPERLDPLCVYLECLYVVLNFVKKFGF